MAKGVNQKLKLLYLLKLFHEKTDETHGVTMDQIIKYLNNNDIGAERKSIYSDIKELKRMGYEIELSNNEYYLSSRPFELSELKLLAAVVQASHVISESKTKKIVEKLKALTSEYNGPAISRNISIGNNVKTNSDNLFKTIDILNEAIEKKKMVHIVSGHYGVKKELEKKSEYTLPALKLFWNNGKYYFYAYDETNPDNLREFRVDRIIKVKIVDDEWNTLKARDIDWSSHITKQIDMGIGEKSGVKLELDKSLIDQIIDLFGKDITITENKGTNNVTVVSNIIVGSTFFSWLMNYGGKIKIIEPQSVITDFKKFVSNNLAAYNIDIKER